MQSSKPAAPSLLQSLKIEAVNQLKRGTYVLAFINLVSNICSSSAEGFSVTDNKRGKNHLCTKGSAFFAIAEVAGAGALLIASLMTSSRPSAPSVH